MKVTNEFWHREIIDLDLPIVAEQFDDFTTVYNLFLTVISKAKRDPIRPQWELQYDLTGWYEYNFFSKETPLLLEKPNMRMIYHYKRTSKNFYVLAIGLRNSKELRDSKEQHSIYYIAAERLKRLDQDCWQRIKK